ncbi:MAG: carbon storage regulator [Lachnospiraceae bacterium]|jgi:carbon storage regulator|nr:carbon storage regulator [Lachnospiraceae bacterium]
MLILRRKKNESLLIGENIRITIIECAGDGVRLAIDAPRQISILREELSEAEQSNKTALKPNLDSVMQFRSLLKLKNNTPGEKVTEDETAQVNTESSCEQAET